VKATQLVRLLHWLQHSAKDAATTWSLVGTTGQLP
jgi:hypothetical protein